MNPQWCDSRNVAGTIVVGLVFLFVAWLSSLCSGQEVGSAAGARTQANLANQAIQDDMDWNLGKKLSPVPLLGKTRKPAGGDRPPELIDEGQEADLHYWEFRVLDVVDDMNCTLIMGGKAIWLEGYPTKGLVSDDKVYLAATVKCTGTKEYTSLSGAKRVVKRFVFLSPQEIQARRDKAAAEQDAKEWPEWHSTAGTSIKAKFIGGAGGVQLLTKEGKKITVPLAKFTDEDKEKLRPLIKEWKDQKRK